MILIDTWQWGATFLTKLRFRWRSTQDTSKQKSLESWRAIKVQTLLLTWAYLLMLWELLFHFNLVYCENQRSVAAQTSRILAEPIYSALSPGNTEHLRARLLQYIFNLTITYIQSILSIHLFISFEFYSSESVQYTQVITIHAIYLHAHSSHLSLAHLTPQSDSDSESVTVTVSHNVLSLVYTYYL